ncbi:MAG: hypothetical protein CVV64_10020 [Candidatus Wallbacteria bacterium HGW-Wallbacteria-1]|jgi:hydrogenase-4 component F|uniref:NADH:quinone oxidoreductase/Mrp antiporter transmembrane domain-containing protein n=1 Tax=Candidatus Wallbacteria bacterium HGW-Wallbacteria-1 TaxID=2013854 RepID=A0A2N1PPM6_9BACT|nr:MAG: hypothetical protein CVV64_10020 [Candidatus Wallbacteria bacterium HGW-Wallbacteria-1]
MTILFLLTPMILSLLLPLISSARIFAGLLWTAMSLNLLISAVTCLPILRRMMLNDFPARSGGLLSLDAVSALLILLQALICLAATGKLCELIIPRQKCIARNRIKVFLSLAFLFSLNGALLSNHIGLYWVFLEASTLISAPLIFLSGSSGSLEAAWKYLFLCSIGISMAFIGIIFLSMGIPPEMTLDFTTLLTSAGVMNPTMLKLAFAFIVMGLGTKAGLAPMHAWLPDAHSEASPGISALLSGVLLNVALLGIARFTAIAMNAGGQSWAFPILLTISITSLLVTAVYMFRVSNYKRMLAYSSIENVGIIAGALAFGKAGIAAAMIHIIGHSLCKAAMFLNTSSIHHHFHSRNIRDVKGLLENHPATGWVWFLGFLGLCGFPPFPAFFSKLMIISLLAKAELWGTTAFFLLLTLTATAVMGRNVISMCMGVTSDIHQDEVSFQLKGSLHDSVKESTFHWVPQALLLALGIACVTIIPMQILTILRGMAQTF